MLLAGGFAYNAHNKNIDANPGVPITNSAIQTQKTETSSYEKQIDEAGGVTVSVNPLPLFNSPTSNF